MGGGPLRAEARDYSSSAALRTGTAVVVAPTSRLSLARFAALSPQVLGVDQLQRYEPQDDDSSELPGSHVLGGHAAQEGVEWVHGFRAPSQCACPKN